MSFQQSFLQMVARQQPELRRQVYAVVTNPSLDRQQKIDYISRAVKGIGMRPAGVQSDTGSDIDGASTGSCSDNSQEHS